MILIAGIFALTVVFGTTYFVLTSIGLRRDSLLYTPDEKRAFDQLMNGRLGDYATVANIFGTLSSFATVYVFFIGTSKSFGIFIVTCVVSLLCGVYVTNAITSRIISIPRVRSFYESLQQTSAVVAAIVWSESKAARINSAWVKYISMSSLIAVIWLEFAIFSDLFGYLSDRSDAIFRSSSFLLVSYSVLFFILRFGLRGFVFTDLIQSPIILVGTTIVAICTWISANSHHLAISVSALQPSRSMSETALFIANSSLLNFCLVLASEAHWMRTWLFGRRETKLQLAGIMCTSLNWLMLIGIGLVAGFVSSNVGSIAVVDIVQYVQSSEPIVAAAFWLAAVAALFSTADANIYGLLLVRSFDTDGGSVTGSLRVPGLPSVAAFLASAVMAATYYIVRSLNLPMEKIIFICIPLCLNVMPSLVSVACFRVPKLSYTVASTVGYLMISLVGLFEPPQQLFTTLAAALCPIVFSVAAAISPKSTFAAKEAR
jgi:hypothetical protein